MSAQVTCEPYGASLPESSCAKRWKLAQQRWHALAKTSCRTCPEGAARANGEAPKPLTYRESLSARPLYGSMSGEGVGRDGAVRREQDARNVRAREARLENIAKARTVANNNRRLVVVPGERIAEWTVLGESPSSDGRTRAVVQCRCGSTRIAALANIRREAGLGRGRWCIRCAALERVARGKVVADAAE